MGGLIFKKEIPNSNKRKPKHFASVFLFYLHIVCHFDEGEISTSNSTKIGNILYGASREDFSFVEMTNDVDIQCNYL